MNWDLWKYNQWDDGKRKFERWSWGTFEELDDASIHSRLFSIKKQLQEISKNLEDLMIILLNQQIGEEE